MMFEKANFLHSLFVWYSASGKPDADFKSYGILTLGTGGDDPLLQPDGFAAPEEEVVAEPEDLVELDEVVDLGSWQ